MRRFALVLVGLFAVASYAADNDPNLWLTDIHGAKPLAWVKQQNARSDAAIKSDPQFAKDRASILTVLNADDRIPEGTLDHQWVFDFWQDASHVRGIWRRTTIADFTSKTPHWQTLLDVDKLDRDTHQNWVWKGSDCTPSFERRLLRACRPRQGAVLDREPAEAGKAARSQPGQDHCLRQVAVLAVVAHDVGDHVGATGSVVEGEAVTGPERDQDHVGDALAGHVVQIGRHW